MLGSRLPDGLRVIPEIIVRKGRLARRTRLDRCGRRRGNRSSRRFVIKVVIKVIVEIVIKVIFLNGRRLFGRSFSQTGEFIQTVLGSCKIGISILE